MHWPRLWKPSQAVFRSVPFGSSPWDCSFEVSLLSSLVLCDSTSPGELLLEALLPCALEEFPDAEEPCGAPALPGLPDGGPPPRPPRCARAGALAIQRITTSESAVRIERFIMFSSS